MLGEDRHLKPRTYRDFDYEVTRRTERGKAEYWTRGPGFETGPHRTLQAADRAARRQINKQIKGGASSMGCAIPLMLAVVALVAWRRRRT